MEKNLLINLNHKAHLFLTSLPGGYSYKNGMMTTDGFYKTNEFINNLDKLWKNDSKILFITATPDNNRASKAIMFIIGKSFDIANLSYDSFDLCDYSNYDQELGEYQVIILGGGHVPTQNKFFEEINLYDRIKNFEGIIIGVSAGSMNSAEIVYAQPENNGEAINPNYKRFLKGLNLTKFQIIPHYYSIKNKKLDGLIFLKSNIINNNILKLNYNFIFII